ncbi:MAG: hypothetical protein HGA38_03875 [Candidatus Moranbacteria bacterium]|nr:hypothetical protein [Candidatus Moranbacteria bacterium]NTW46014.1 hypothetical protein [Candidatus Moranbacteria bacterium]
MTMTEAFREEMKAALLASKSRLESELGLFADKKDGEYEARYEDIGTDRDDNATEVEQYSDNVALEENLESQLNEVKEALGRIEAGTYGICAECGQEIEEGRLRAYPAAKECISCAKA